MRAFLRARRDRDRRASAPDHPSRVRTARYHFLVSTATAPTPLARRRTPPVAPIHGAPRPIVTRHPAIRSIPNRSTSSTSV